jgi:predicted amidohydrolase
MAEKAGEEYHIAQAVIGPDGYIGKYRKYHPT